MKFLLLTDCRTGSTWLTDRLGETFSTKHEKLVGQELSTAEFSSFLKTSFDDCDGWDLKRFQIPYEGQWWELNNYCSENDVKVISLTRRNIYDQWLSYSKACQTGIWTRDNLAEALPILSKEQIQSYLEFSNLTRYLHLREDRWLTCSRHQVYFEDLFGEEQDKVLDGIHQFLDGRE